MHHFDADLHLEFEFETLSCAALEPMQVSDIMQLCMQDHNPDSLTAMA